MRRNFEPHHARPAFRVGGILVCLVSLRCFAQTAPPQATDGAPSGTPLIIPLDEAIRRAQANEPNFAIALGEAKATALDRSIAPAALRPNAVHHNQFLYTQGNGQ